MTLPLSGIYKITNMTTGHIYVGQSKNVYHRRIEHFAALSRGKHENKLMQKEWNANHRGFRFDVIEFCSLADLNKREKYWIDTLKCMAPNGFNQDWVPYKRKTKEIKRKVKKYRKTR